MSADPIVYHDVRDRRGKRRGLRRVRDPVLRRAVLTAWRREQEAADVRLKAAEDFARRKAG
jgi:hypothetical protein